MATAGRPRPGRFLAVVALVIVGLYLGLFLGPSKTPALGLDLRGGTQVTLKAQPLVKGQPVNRAAVDQAIDIIRDRVNGLGVGGAEISRQGNTNITVAVPGKGRDQVVKTLGSTALLRFRQVLEERSALPSTTSTPTISPSTSPSPTATSSKASSKKTSHTKKKSRGDALSSVLTKGGKPAAKSSKKPSPKPSARGSVSPTATPSPASSPSASSASATPVAQAPSITAGLTAEFNKVDCLSKQNNPTQGSDEANNYIVSCDKDGTAAYLLGPAKLLGTDVKTASAELPTTGGLNWEIDLTFTGSGGNKWYDLTKTAYEADPSGNTTGTCTPPTGCNAVAIVLDGITQSAPASQQDGIAGGSTQITGSFTQTQADQLAEVLKYGALPLKFVNQDVESVSATLGSSQLRGGLIAGIIGLGLVILFSLLYYRALGFVTIGSLAVSGLILYAVTTLLGHSSVGYTLSLPGIAGFIVAVGITADSFVVFFERLRDEIRDGRRLRSGVENAWPRARRTIISADFVSLLAAFVLYVVSIGDVRGFAFTLGLSTLSDLFIVFFFTKPLMTVLARVRAFDTGKSWTGVGRARVGAVREQEAVARRTRSSRAEA